MITQGHYSSYTICGWFFFNRSMCFKTYKILYRSLLVITLLFSTTDNNSFAGILNNHESNCQSMSNVGSGSTCCRSNDFFKKSCENCQCHSQLSGNTITVLDKIFTNAKLEGDKALQVCIWLSAKKCDQGERGTLPVCIEGNVFDFLHFDFTFFSF